MYIILCICIIITKASNTKCMVMFTHLPNTQTFPSAFIRAEYLLPDADLINGPSIVR